MLGDALHPTLIVIWLNASGWGRGGPGRSTMLPLFLDTNFCSSHLRPIYLELRLVRGGARGGGGGRTNFRVGVVGFAILLNAHPWGGRFGVVPGWDPSRVGRDKGLPPVQCSAVIDGLLIGVAMWVR